MVDEQITARGARRARPRELEAMRDVPRHPFVGEDAHAQADEDRPGVRP